MGYRGHIGKTLLRTVVVALCFGGWLSAQAANKTWNDGGGANTNWNLGSNWGGTAPISGVDSLTFAGVLGLTNFNNFAASSTFNGITFASGAGAFLLNGNAIILGGNITNSSTTLQTINLNLLLSNTRVINAASGDITLNGVISGGFGITKQGNFTLTLSAPNTYTGVTTINAGDVKVQNNTALGTTAAGTTVASGAAVLIAGSGLTVAEAITSLIGDGGGTGALENLANNNTWSGAITLGSGGARINSDAGLLTLSGGITGGGFGLTVGGAGNTLITAALPATVNSLTKDGSGTLILSNTANAYVGATLISAGTLKLALSNVLPDGASKGDVTVNGTLDMAGFSDTINGLNGGGTVDNSTGTGNTLTVGSNNVSSVFSGVIQDTSGSLGLTKTGTGTLTLSGNSANTYSGVTTVNAGELDLNKTAGVNAIGAGLTVAGGSVKLLANEQIADGAAVTVNSGSFNLNGATETVGNMIIGSSGLLTNGVTGGTLNGGITNAGTIFVSQDTFLNGPVTNMGAMFFRGAISNNLVNRTTFTLNDDTTITTAPVNTGTMDANGNTLTVSPDWANSGTILLGGGVLAGGNLTNNNVGTVAEFGTVSNQLINAGVVTATNGELRLVGVASGAGSYKAVAGASAATLTFAGGGSISALFNTNATIRLENVLTNNSLFVNQGTIALAGGTYQSTASLTNVAGKVVIGSGTISAQRLVNLSTAILEATNGTLTLLQAPVMQGIVNVRGDGTLQFGDTGSPLVVTNATTGSIRLYGGTLSFGTLTNFGDLATFAGGGTLTGLVINAGNGSIDATNGTLVFLNDLNNVGLVTNKTAIQIGSDSMGAITNAGTLVLAGGTFNAGVITNTGTLLGFGVNNADVLNSGLVGATNGELRLLGSASGAGTYRTVAGASAATLTFAGGGSISALFNTGSTIRVENSVLTNTASFINRGTLTLAGGTYQSSASVNNTGAFQVENAAGTVGTLNAALVNAGTIDANSGTLTLLVAPTQNGAVTIAAGGVLNVVPDWANNGTINFTAGGAITGGTLTNISASGTMAGAGFINSFLVNQNRLDINGLTVSNNFVQTGGSFTVSGASTITGSAALNGGTLNLQGKSLAVDSLILAPGATLTNGIANATLNGDITNAGTVNVTADLYVLGAVSNTGTWIQRGAISNNVVNAGTMNLVTNTINPRVTGGIMNSGSLTFTGTGFVSGAVTNSGSISFNGAISNNYVQTAGSITLANTATITGTANVTGGNFDLNGKTYTNGQMIVSGTGVLTNNVAGASFSGGLSNDATVAVTADTFFKGPVTNTGAFFFRGAISNSFVNSDTFVLNNNATITGSVVNNGTFNLDGDTFTVNPAWANSGTILLLGGTVAGGTLTNASGATIKASGNISTLLVNNGLVIVTNGTLALSVAPQQNGVIAVADGAAPGTLNVTPAWANGGTISVANSAVITGGALTNLAGGTVTNLGVINTLLVNQGRVDLAGVVSNSVVQTSGSFTVSGTSTITGNATINGGTLNLQGNRLTNGVLIVGGTGVVTNGVIGATVNGGVSNAATITVTANTYFNGPVTNLGTFLFEGAISNNFVQTAGATRLNDDGTITGIATISGGSFNLNGNNYSNRLMVISGTGVLTNAIAGATFSGGLSNAATIAVTADTFFTGPVTNTGAMFFQGPLSNTLVNSGSFNLNNNATLTVAPVNNGTINAAASTLTVAPAWANAGSFQISGGVLAGGTVTNLNGEGFFGFGTISNLVVNNGTLTASGGTLTLVIAPVNNATAIVANASALNVLPDWTNSGVLSNAPTGAVSGGTLTNTGTINGLGFFNQQIVNQNRMNFGGTISNNFLQTAGSFTVTADATVTGTNTITGGVLNLLGNNLTNGLLVISGTGILTNATIGATLVGAVSNDATVNFASDVYVLGAVTNTGFWLQRGAISNNVVNLDTMLVLSNSIAARITGSIVNSGSLTFTNSFASGPVTNSGSFSFSGAISNNYVQTAGSITLNNTATITGTAKLTTGAFDLNGKTYTNGLMIVGGSGVLTSSQANAIFNGGLSNAGTVAIPLNVTFNGPVTNLAAFSWQGTINNNYAQGAGTNLFNGNSTITGNTAISDGLVNFNGKNGTFGSLNGGGGTLLNNGNGASVLTVNNGGSFSGTIADHTVGTGTMALTVGGGVLTLGGNNTYSGITTAKSGGTIKLGSATALGSTAGNTVVSSGGVLDINGQTVGNEELEIAGTGISNGGALINSSGTAASLAGDINNVASDAGVYSVGGTGDITLSGNVQGRLTKVSSNTLTLGGTVDNVGLGITVSNGVVVLAKDSNGGVHALGGAGFTLAGGTIQLGGTGDDQIYDFSFITINSGTFDFNGRSETLSAIVGSGGTILNNGGGASTINLGIDNGSQIYSGVIADHTTGSGTMALVKSGTGTETFSGNNSYTGGTTVSNGMLRLGNANALGTGGLTMSGGTLNLNQFSVSVANLSGNSGTILANNGIGAATYTLTVGSDNTSTAYGGVIANNTDLLGEIVALTKTGTGVLTLSGANSYSGNTVIQSGGAINIQSANALGSTTAGTTVNSGGALQIQGGITTLAESLTLNGTGVSNNGGLRNISGNNTFSGAITLGSATRINSDAGTLTLNVVISGSGFGLAVGGAGSVTVGGAINGTGTTLTKDGTGVVTLSGADAYTGVTTINAGTLRLGASGVIPDGSVVTVNGGQLDLNGKTETVGALIIKSGGVLTNGTAGAALTGGITNGGTVFVSQSTSFNGVVTNTSVFSWLGAINNNYVQTAGTNTLNGSGTITGTATIAGGLFNLNGQTYSNGLMVVSGSGALSNGIAGATFNGGLSNNATVVATANTFFNGVVTNTGAFVWQGAISNNYVQTAGTNILNDDGTITRNATIAGGLFNLNGQTYSNGLMIVSGSGILTSGVAGATFNGGLSNAATVAITANTFFNGPVTNTGTFSWLGAISNNYVQTAGTNILAGNATITQNAVVNGGLFDLNGQIYSNNLMAVGGSGVLTSSQANATFNGGLSNAATVSLSQNTFFNGVVTNTGAFLWQGAISNNFVNSGTVRLNNDATITGIASISGGSFNLNGNNYSNRLMVISGTGVLTNAIAGATFNGGLSNAATVAVTGDTFFNGPVTNLGAMFFQGAISNNALVNNGSFNLNNDATLTVAPLNNGTINVAASTLTVNPAWANAGSFQINGGVLAGGNVTNLTSEVFTGFGTISNLIVNQGIVNASGGTLTLVNAPVQSGGVTVASGGVLNVIPDWSSSGTITVNAGGAISGGTLTNTSATGTLSGSGFIKTFVVNLGRMDFGGTISNNLLQTAGSFTLSGSATITGTASINGGTLDLNGNRLTDSSLTIGAGGVLTNGVQNATLNGGITNAGLVNLFRDVYINGPVTNTGTWIQRGAISNNVVNAGTMTLLTNSINLRVTGSIVNSGSLTFDTNGIIYVSGVVSNSGSFLFGDVISNNLVNTAGSITLNGTATVTGSTMVNGGTFDLNGKTFTNSFMVVGSSAVLTSSQANAIFNGGLSNAGTVAIPLNVTFNGPVTNLAAFSWQGTINNGYAQGAGTNLFNGNSTITGNTAISDGLVNFNGKNGTFGSLNGGGGTLLNNGNGASVLTVNNGGSFSGTIADHTVGTGTMALTVGGGVLTVSGNNTYSGVTTINSGGTLKTGSGNALGSTAGNTVVSSGGVLDLNGQVIGGEPLTLNGTGISSSGALINSSGTAASLSGAIILGSASSIGGNGDLTESGVISGGNSLTKVGAGTVTLTAANGYTGTTIISNGVLNIQNNTALGTAAGGVTVASGAALELQGGITVGADALSLNGTGVSNGGALRNVSGNNTYGGAITLAGVSRINSDAGTLTLGGGITGGGSAVTIGGAGNVVVTSTIGGTSTTLTKDGAGTLNLTGNNTYTGATIVNGGTLKVNNASGSGISGGSVTVNNGGTLGGTGTITVGVTVNNGGHIAPGNSVGTFNVATLTLASGSVLDFEFNSNPANDLINVLNSGGLTLNGGGFNLYEEGTATAWSTAGTYDLISYSGALGGSIGNLSVLNPAAAKVYTFGNTGSMITLQIAGGQSWTGLGSDNFWSSGANWSTATPTAGDLLVFDGATRINNTNNLAANTQFVGITYDVGAGAFTNSGNAVNLTGDIVNNSTNTQTIKLPLVLDGGNRTINAASGALVVSGPISDTNGTWELIKSGAGTLTLSGNTANTYGGLTTVNTGELDLNKTAGQDAVGGDLSVGSGATVRLLAGEQIGDTAIVTVNNGGQFNLNGFAETIGGMANAGTIVVGGGALTVSQTLQNSGAVTLSAGGAIAGGVLTNLTSGLVSGSGFIKSFVVNQGRLNFGGTISNNLLQTAGSFTLSGSATITGTASINGGTLDLNGNRLTDSSLTIGAGGVLTNGVQNATLNGGITNAGLVNLFRDVYINGPVTNTGTWIQRGAISNNVVNAGTMTLLTNSINLRVTGSIVNSGSLTFDTNGIIYVSGAVSNSGSFLFGDVISNNLVNTAGSITLNGTATVTGSTVVNGGTLNLNGKNLASGSMVISGSGLLTNGVAGASVSGGLSNDATVAVTANTFFKGPVTNTGSFFFQGAISNTFVSSDTAKLLGAGTITGTASITGGTFDLNGKSLASSQLIITSAGVLTNSTAGASVSGAVTLQNSTLSGQLVTNNATVSGSGTISAPLNNTAVGVISANSGLLTIAGALTQNGTINVAAGSTLDVPQAFSNSGSLNMQGGFLVGGTVTVTAGDNISGFGTISNDIVNAGLITATGGTLTLAGGAPTTQSGSGINIASGGTLSINEDWANSGTMAVTGTLIGGAVTNTSNTGTLSGSGTIRTFVVNQGRMNFGGTITSNLLQNSGSFTLSGNATITGNATISGGGVDLVNNLLTAGLLTINNGATMQNSGNPGTLNGNVVNSGTVNFNVNAAANDSSVAINGRVVNSGAWTQAGAINGDLINSGSFNWTTHSYLLLFFINENGATPHLTGSITNSGSLTFDPSFAAQVGGSVVNSGTININGTVGGAYMQTAGRSALNDNLSISGSTTITGGSFDLNGKNYTGTRTTVDGTGILTNSIANATFNGGLSNAANVGVTANTFFKGTVTNTGTFAFMGAVSNTLVNSGDVILNGSGTISGVLANKGSVNVNSGVLSLVVAPTQTGSITVNAGATLNAAQAWVNSGSVNLQGGSLVGATVTNAGTMTGFGGVQNVVNNLGLYVTNGTLHVTTSLVQNGGVDVAANGKLDVTPTWLNNGSVVIGGGFLTGGTLTNAASALLRGFGTVSNAMVNLGTTLVTNGTLNLVSAPTHSGTITIANAATLNVLPAWLNSGLANVQGGTVIGGSVTNTGMISGFGTFSPSVINNNSGTITAASGGALTLTAIPLQNGLVNILGTLNVASAWSNGNTGTVSLNGGVLTGGTFTVDGTVAGNGTIAANTVISHAKTVTVSGGQMNLTALTTINGGLINSGTVANSGTISGNGTVNSALANTGYVRATNGLLNVQTLADNQAAGTLEASTGGTLAANGVTPWLNNGRVILSGGTVIGGDISNNTSKVISGFGTISPNVYNSGQILANNAGQALTLDHSLVNLAGGVVTASTGRLVVNGAFSNAGTLSMINSLGTFAGPVVNSGAWVTDPTTNVFQNTYTLTSSGFIQSAGGDAYIFSNDANQVASFVNQSTQSNAFSTTGKFVFDASLSLTQTFYTAGNNIGNLDTNGGFNLILVSTLLTNFLAQYQDNFALGALEIGSTSLVADAFVDGGRNHGGLEAALFLSDLTLDAGAHLIISNDVQVYFITSNAFTSGQVTLLGNGGLHQLTTDPSLVIPEPSVILLWLSSIVTVYAARRRNAGPARSRD